MNVMEVGEVKKVVRVSDKNRGQDRFFIDVSDDDSGYELIERLLREANNKQYGRKVILKDLVMAALPKLKEKDIEAIKEASVTPMEHLRRKTDDYNEMYSTKLKPIEYFAMALQEGRSIQ